MRTDPVKGAVVQVDRRPRLVIVKPSDVERARFASICVLRSAIFCSVVAIASAPAMKRRGGGSWLAFVMSARASFAGSPDCFPFCDFQYSTSGPLRSSASPFPQASVPRRSTR